MKKFAAIITAGLTLVSCAETPESNTLISTKSGEQIYAQNCIACHGEDGTEGSGGAADLKSSVYTTSEVRNVILNGNEKGMMSYKGLIDEGAEMDSLIKFVENLRK